ncbi:MAG TPA: hypothetical protein VKE96_30500 [Vicinamibacterales bacterium]|nr:hypothetical protein [Vicinamibacterales bacterium]
MDVTVGSVASELASAATALMTGTESVGPPARLANGEFRNRARGWLLSFRARQRRANQPAVNRTVFLAALAVVILVVLLDIRVDHVVDVCGGLGMSLFGCRRDGKRFLDRRFLDSFNRRDGSSDLLFDAAIRGCSLVRDAFGTSRGDLRIECSRCFALAALAWDFRVLVLVLGVARRAARLLDVVANHCDHGVVG